ncbi:MAG: hypothetical protein ACRDPH_12575 [Marmoricola sp.]
MADSHSADAHPPEEPAGDGSALPRPDPAPAAYDDGTVDPLSVARSGFIDADQAAREQPGGVLDRARTWRPTRPHQAGPAERPGQPEPPDSTGSGGEPGSTDPLDVLRNAINGEGATGRTDPEQPTPRWRLARRGGLHRRVSAPATPAAAAGPPEAAPGNHGTESTEETHEEMAGHPEADQAIPGETAAGEDDQAADPTEGDAAEPYQPGAPESYAAEPYEPGSYEPADDTAPPDQRPPDQRPPDQEAAPANTAPEPEPEPAPTPTDDGAPAGDAGPATTADAKPEQHEQAAPEADEQGDAADHTGRNVALGAAAAATAAAGAAAVHHDGQDQSDGAVPTGQASGEPATTSARQEGAAEPPAEDEPLPESVEYRSSAIARTLLGLMVAGFTVAAVIALFIGVGHGSIEPILLAICFALLAAACWWRLMSWGPTIVAVDQGHLEIAHGPRSEHFDLHDPDLRVVVGDDPGSSAWTTELSRPGGEHHTINRRQVRNPEEFSKVVLRHRRNALADRLGQGRQHAG